MHSSSSGPLTTLLMLVPLIAVPALAIFGVPNVDALNGSTDPAATAGDGATLGDEADAPPSRVPRPLDPADSELGEGFIPAATSTPSDPFLKAGASGRRRNEQTAEVDAGDLGGLKRSRSTGPRSKPNTPSEVDGDAFDSTTGSRDLSEEIPFGMPEEPAERGTTPRGTAAKSRGTTSRSGKDVADGETPRDWRAATARLKELGIRDFHLTNGEGEHQFLFTCRYVMPDNPRVVRRFEAEAAEPLGAVEDVLSQVETWLSGK